MDTRSARDPYADMNRVHRPRFYPETVIVSLVSVNN